MSAPRLRSPTAPSSEGAGTSQLSHNVAYQLSRLFDAETAVVDLDLAYGTVGLDFNLDSPQSAAAVLGEPDRIDDAIVQRSMAKYNDNLHILTGPQSLVATAATTGNPRERLAASARELERLAQAAERPVRLRLESDGQTQIAIYRVGQYGSFARRDVELLPGRYTVVGTRTGYRDVRLEVVLPPGAEPAAVVVHCEEPI